MMWCCVEWCARCVSTHFQVICMRYVCECICVVLAPNQTGSLAFYSKSITVSDVKWFFMVNLRCCKYSCVNLKHKKIKRQFHWSRSWFAISNLAHSKTENRIDKTAIEMTNAGNKFYTRLSWCKLRCEAGKKQEEFIGFSSINGSRCRQLVSSFERNSTLEYFLSILHRFSRVCKHFPHLSIDYYC